MRTARGAVQAVALLLIALAGTCSAATVEVHLKDEAFAPASISINASDTVVFINDDPHPHDVLFEAGFGTGAPGTLAAGANWSHTFDTNGSYKFRCQLHSGNFNFGMVGKVIVGAPPPEPAKTPGFEGGWALAAVLGAAAWVCARRRLT